MQIGTQVGIKAKSTSKRDADPSIESLTTMETLRSHIATLACVEETSAPFVSCYINLEQGKGSYDKVLEERASTVRSTIEKSAHADFDAAMHEIKSYLAKKVRPDAKGVAIFSRQLRTGNFFLPMQFAAPLPNWMAVYDVPNLFHLMTLKDTYHRYVVLLATRARCAFSKSIWVRRRFRHGQSNRRCVSAWAANGPRSITPTIAASAPRSS